LAGAYFLRTGDREFLSLIWPNIQSALRWIDIYGDADHDGFVEYARRASTGLVQQGWKDSNDSVFHSNGHLAEPPIALCEVQGYVYDAKYRMSLLLRRFGNNGRADQFRREATQMAQVKHDHLAQVYAFALDAGDLAVFSSRGYRSEKNGRMRFVEVRHGMRTVTRGERYALGLVLHLAE
jgi:glycogen debranching enzyme